MANHTHSLGFFAGEVLERCARKAPSKTALIAREGELSFSELNEKVTRLVCHLHNEGVAQGNRVGILLPNSISFALSYYATQRLGAVAVILDARLRGRELLGILEDADLSLVITHARLMGEVVETLKPSRPIPVWAVGGEGEPAFERRLAPGPKDFTRPRLQPQDDAIILYTSGTTGEPKGVVLSYANLSEFPRVMGEVCHTAANEILGCVLPMSHISGPIYCNEIVDKGGTMVIFDQMNPINLLEGIQKYRITLFHGVPPIFQLLLGVPNLKDYDTSSVEIAAMMGTTVPPSLMRAFKGAQPHIRVTQGYGLTESSPLITLTEPQRADEKMASIGKAVPGIEVKIVDERKKEVSVGEVGEIITRGPHLMKGYFRKPEATAERIVNGWLYTGDLGKKDRDGYYYHLGRKDDMIITGGLNLYPAEVENLVYEFPQVQEAVVFPIPDEKRGKLIGVAVVPRQGGRIEEKELMKFLRANLASFKVPQTIAIRDSLPRTSSGKVIRDASTLLS